MEKEILALLNPQLAAEMAARYFYEAFRTWARAVGYEGAERQAKCYCHYHKHNIKCLLNIFADWDMDAQLAAIPPPAELPNDLPAWIERAQEIEQGLMEGYNAAAHDIFDMDMGIYNDVRDLQKRQVGFFQEMSEFVEKLNLIDVRDRLSLLYFDRKVLRW